MAGISTGPMTGQTVLVTGGTGGIGRATVTGLAAMGAQVGITGHDTAGTRAAATEIAAASGNSAVDRRRRIGRLGGCSSAELAVGVASCVDSPSSAGHTRAGEA